MPYGYDGTYIIVGPPGCGKTTFLAKQCREIVTKADRTGMVIKGESPVLVSSLTKAAAEEVGGRDLPIPKQAVATLHAHGLRSMGSPVIVNSDYLAEWNVLNPSLSLTPDDYDAGDMMGQSSEHNEEGDEIYRDYHLARHRCTPREKWELRIRKFADKWEAWKTDMGIIDYTDMIEFASETPPLNPGVIICDECQDMSRLEQNLLTRWGEAAGALIMVGDPYQSLYNWRGADPYFLIDADVPDTHRKVLSQSYRVPSTVHRRAVGLITNLTKYKKVDYKPTPEPGVVSDTMATILDPDMAVAEAAGYAAEGKSVMFIAYANYMLRPLVKELRIQGLPFSNPWRPRDGGWNPLGQRKGVTIPARLASLLRPARPVHGSERTMWTCKDVHQWSSVLTAKGLMQPGAKASIKEAAENRGNARVTDDDIWGWFTDDMFSPMKELWNWFLETDRDPDSDPVTTPISWWVDRLGKTAQKSMGYYGKVLEKQGYLSLFDRPKIHVGTIHSFKGGEADVVFLFPDLPFAAYQGYVDGGGEDYDSVIRAFYVGMTRPRERLVVCQPSSSRFISEIG